LRFVDVDVDELCIVRDVGLPTGEMTSREERKYVDKSGVEGTDNLHFYSALARYQTNSLAQEMLTNGESYSYGKAVWRISGATRCEVLTLSAWHEKEKCCKVK